MAFDVWLTFVFASTALLLIPGPTVLLVLSYALSQGCTVAITTAAGVALGDLIAMTAPLAGLGALVLASATLFVALKWIGAVYLLYLGVKLIRSAPKSSMSLADTSGPMAASSVFLHAATVTALNPKSIAFFIAFVLLADKLRRRIERPRVLGWLTGLGGSALIAMGVMTALLRPSTS